MKPILHVLFVLCSTLRVSSPDTTGVTITVTLENVMNDQGDILAALHTAETFMKGAGIDNFKSAAEKGSMTFQFKDVAPGIYAISVLHDLNQNNRMDFQPGGMPKEPYGMSGNDMSMGPPTFESVKFQVGDSDMHLRIRF